MNKGVVMIMKIIKDNNNNSIDNNNNSGNDNDDHNEMAHSQRTSTISALFR